MKKTILSIAVIAAAFVAASCQKENLQENNASEGSASVFTATIETVAGTKTTVERIDGSLATYKTYWESTDQISINGVTYTATPDVTDATKATFTTTSGSVPTATFKAYFPANLYNNGTPTLPANVSETWVDGKYNMPMYATSTTASLSFKNLCGVLKITVTNAQLASVKCITVSSTNCATSGAFTVSGDAAVLTAASNTANTVTVTYTDAVNTEATGKVFYVAIPAKTYKNLSIAVSDGTTTKVMTTKSNQDIVVDRNTIYPITFNGQPTTGTAARTGDNVNWVQLWANGPKFAEYNVGACNNKAEDDGEYYDWNGDATVTNLWGSNWRMPTSDELGKKENDQYIDGLLGKCTCVWTTNYNSPGVNGLLCTGKGAYASNSVFLPAAGLYIYLYGELVDYGNLGNYWSSTPRGDDNAYILDFSSGNLRVGYQSRVDYGCYIRAVLAE